MNGYRVSLLVLVTIVLVACFMNGSSGDDVVVLNTSPSLVRVKPAPQTTAPPPPAATNPNEEASVNSVEPAPQPQTTSAPSAHAMSPPVGTALPEHQDNNHHYCADVADRDRVINGYEMRVVCDDPRSGIHIREYVQRKFEYKPQVFLYENVDVDYFNGDFLPNPCPVGTFFEEEKRNEVAPWAQGEKAREEYNNRPVRHIKDRTYFKIKRFDVYNIYEAFHAYFNAYLAIQALQLNQSQVQFVMCDDRQGDSPKDALWWSSMNRNAFPIIYSNNHGQHNVGMVDGIAYRARIVRASSSGTSILTSNKFPLQGRSRDHHCKSSAFRAGVAWMRDNFASTIQYSLVRPLPKTVVVWSSRRPYQRDFHYNHVPRQLPREEAFISALQNSLGADEYEVRNVDFGALNPDKSVEEATNADVIVGVHGAGLTWAAFLPRHGGLVELFGGDRGSNNRHYHNLASLADIHYRSTTLGGMNWNAQTVGIITRLIKGMPLHKASAEP